LRVSRLATHLRPSAPRAPSYCPFSRPADPLLVSHDRSIQFDLFDQPIQLSIHPRLARDPRRSSPSLLTLQRSSSDLLLACAEYILDSITSLSLPFGSAESSCSA
jgi:hypothetical protein